MKDGRLTAADKATPLWHDLEHLLTQRLEKLHLDNDADLNQTDTAKVRGRIAEIKAMLRLATEKPAPSA